MVKQDGQYHFEFLQHMLPAKSLIHTPYYDMNIAMSEEFFNGENPVQAYPQADNQMLRVIWSLNSL